jgi:hypothetical protein
VANDEERHEGDDEQEGKPEKMSCIFEAIHRANVLPEVTEALRWFQCKRQLIDRSRGIRLYVTVGTGEWCWVGGWVVTGIKARGCGEGLSRL